MIVWIWAGNGIVMEEAGGDGIGHICEMSDAESMVNLLFSMLRHQMGFMLFHPQVVMEETGGDGIGRICEMSGAESMVNSQFSLLRKGGRIVQVGLLKKPLYVPNVLSDICEYISPGT